MASLAALLIPFFFFHLQRRDPTGLGTILQFLTVRGFQNTCKKNNNNNFCISSRDGLKDDEDDDVKDRGVAVAPAAAVHTVPAPHVLVLVLLLVLLPVAAGGEAVCGVGRGHHAGRPLPHARVQPVKEGDAVRGHQGGEGHPGETRTRRDPAGGGDAEYVRYILVQIHAIWEICCRRFSSFSSNFLFLFHALRGQNKEVGRCGEWQRLF